MLVGMEKVETLIQGSLRHLLVGPSAEPADQEPQRWGHRVVVELKTWYLIQSWLVAHRSSEHQLAIVKVVQLKVWEGIRMSERTRFYRMSEWMRFYRMSERTRFYRMSERTRFRYLQSSDEIRSNSLKLTESTLDLENGLECLWVSEY